MKRFFYLLSIGLILLLTSWLLWHIFTKDKGIPKSDVITLLPDNTALLVKCKSISRLYELLERTDSTLWGKEISQHTRLGTFTTKDIASYLSPLDSLAARGVDPSREVGFTLHEVKTGFDQANSSALIFIPIYDRESFKTLFNYKNSAKLEKVSDKSRDYEYYEIKHSRSPFLNYATFKSGYFWIVVGATSGACELTLDRLNGSKTLAESPLYLTLENELSTNDDLLVFTNYHESPEIRGLFLGFLQTVVQNFESSIAAPLGAQLLNINKQAGLYSFQLAGGTLHGTTSYINDTIGSSRAIKPLDHITEQLSSTPLLLSSFNSDLRQSLYDMDAKLTPFDSPKVQHRSAFFKEIAPLLGRRIHLSLHRTEEISLHNLNAVLALEVMQPAKMDSLFTHYLDLTELDTSQAFTKVRIGKRELFRLTLMNYNFYILSGGENILISSNPVFLPQLTGQNMTLFPQESYKNELQKLSDTPSDTYLIINLKEAKRIIDILSNEIGIGLTMPEELQVLTLLQKSSHERVLTRFTLSSSYEQGYLRSIIAGLSSTKSAME